MSMGNKGREGNDALREYVYDDASHGNKIGEPSKYYKRLDRKGQEAFWLENHVFRVTIVPGFLGGSLGSLEAMLSKFDIPNLWAISSYEEGSENYFERPELTEQAKYCTQAYFTAAEGMGMEFEYTPYQEGGSTVTQHFFKKPKEKTLVFKYGMIVNSNTTFAVQSWLLAQRQGIRLIFHGSIELMSSVDFEVRRTWTFMNARLVSYETTGLEAGNNAGKDVIETMKFVCNGCY